MIARTQSRQFRVLGVAVFVAIVASLIGPVSPAAAMTGGLNGRLQVSPSSPADYIAGASVEIYTLDQQLVTTLTTDSDGRFSWNPAPAGQYKMYFDTNTPRALNFWWSGAYGFDEAMIVSIGADDFVSIGAAVPPASRIVGSATDPSLFSLLSGAHVQAYRIDGAFAGSTVTDGSGAFALEGLYPNLYRLAITPSSGGYARQFWPNATFIEQSTLIDLSGNFGRTATGIDMEFAAGGSVSGNATVAGSGAFAEGLSVEVFNERDELVAVGETAANGQYQVFGLRTGDHYIRFGGVTPSAFKIVYLGGALTATAADRFSATQSADFPDADIVVQLADAPPVVERLAGANRYATAVQVTQAFDPGIPVLYVATGEGFADALSAAAAAVALNGALLLTPPTQLPSAVATEIVRLQPEQVVVVGGTGVVSQAVYQQIAAQLPSSSTIRRDAGANRYETSRIIAQQAFGASASTKAYIADGRNFPDALVASVPSGLTDAPVILVNGASGSVDTATASLLDSLNVDNVTIVGGAGAVSDGLRTSIDALPGITDVGRRSGADRYATAVAVNLDVPDGATAYFATGTGFADALAGAALAGADAAPIFLVRPTCVPPAVLARLDVLAPSRIVLLGGTGALSASVATLTSC